MLANQSENQATKPTTANGSFFGRGGRAPFFQAKLTVNQPGDAHEHEADAVTDQVMRMHVGDVPIVQRMPLTTVSDVQRACAHCEKDEEQAQRKATGGGDASGKAAPAIVSEVLSSGGGQYMDGGTRQFMESRFGQDFSSVRIHTGSRAAESAGAIQARAYTSGRDVVFGKGEYQPTSDSGRRLLAHELVHVGQQRTGIARTSLPFIPATIAAHLKEAIEGWGTNETAIYAALGGRTPEETEAISLAYQRLTRRDLRADLIDDLTRAEMRYLVSISAIGPGGAPNLQSQAQVIAEQLKDAMDRWGTNEETIYAALNGRSPQDIAAIEQAYLQLTGNSLDADLQDELTRREYARVQEIMRGTGLRQLAYFDDDIRLSNVDIENSVEYTRFMDPASEWQLAQHVTADEARTASLLILSHLQNRGAFNFATDAASFIQTARKRLVHSASMPAAVQMNAEIQVLTEQAANQLFQQMSTLTFFNSSGVETAIPFHYPADGCYARAHLMAQRMTALGYASRRKFIISNRPGRLTVQSDYSLDAAVGARATTNWGYHVAPIILMQRADGRLEDMVIDPSLASAPLTVGQWSALMRNESFDQVNVDDLVSYLQNHNTDANVTVTASRNAFYPDDITNSPSAAHAAQQMQDIRGRISNYAQGAIMSELAALIRMQLRGNYPDISAILAQVNSMPPPIRRAFFSIYPNLHLEIQQRLTPSDLTTLTNALNR